jgi:hypothetical protein
MRMSVTFRRFAGCSQAVRMLFLWAWVTAALSVAVITVRAASPGTIPTSVLDLGQDAAFDAVHLWAYSGISGVNNTIQGNSARTLEFRFNTDVQGVGAFSGPMVHVTRDHGPLSQTPAGFILPRQDFALGSQTARLVEMRITDNGFVAPGDGTAHDEHGHLIRGGDRVGLGEVRFSAVPEPGAVAGFAAWRRRVT